MKNLCVVSTTDSEKSIMGEEEGRVREDESEIQGVNYLHYTSEEK